MSCKEQQIKNAHDSTINQAGGNITITMVFLLLMS